MSEKQKILTIFLIAIIGFGYGYSQNGKKTSWETDKLRDKVKSVRLKGYSVITDAGQLSKNQIIEDKWGYNNTLIKYDEKGHWTEYSSYKPDDSIIRLEIMRYDNEGNALEMFVYNYGVIEHKRVFKNDDSGNIIEMLRYNANDSLSSKSVYLYDEKGNQIESYFYTVTDSLISKTINNYDKNRNCIESINYGTNGTISAKILYKYDSLGNRIERVNYDSTENLTEKSTYQYDEKSSLIEVSTFNSKDNSNKIITYNYKYDTKDNWIEKTDFINNIATKITEREIEYY